MTTVTRDATSEIGKEMDALMEWRGGGAWQCIWKKATDFFHDSKRYLQLTWSAGQRFAFCHWGATEDVERSRAECWRLGLGSRGRCCRNLGFILLLSRWAGGQQRATGFDLPLRTVDIPDGTIHSRSEPPSCSYFLLPFFFPSSARHLAVLGPGSRCPASRFVWCLVRVQHQAAP